MTTERRKQDIETIAALTALQQGVLFHALERGHEDPYHYQRVFVLQGELSVARFEQAWQQASDRHQALRTDFIVGESDVPLQVVYKRRPVVLEQLDWRDQPPAAQRAALEAWLAVQRAEGFPFRRAADMRLRLMRVGPSQWWLAWSFHHIAMDGWSVGLVLSDVLRAYLGHALPSPARPFSQYLQWLGQRDHAASLSHWQSVLDQCDGRTSLPDAGSRSARAGYAEQRLSVSKALSSVIRDQARAQGVTMNTVVQALWGWLLARHAGADGALFGATVSGRSGELPGIEQTVGLFINTLPHYVHVPSDLSVRDWWQAVQRAAVTNQQHEHTPLPDIQRLRDGGSLFDSIVVFENYPVDAALRQPADGLDIRLLDLRVSDDTLASEQSGGVLTTHGRNNFPLSLIAVAEEQLHLTLAYQRGAFDDATIAALLRQLEAGLEAMAAAPDSPLGRIALDGRRIDPQAGVARGESAAAVETVLDAWQRHLRAEPDALALIDEQTSLTRTQADTMANGLAHALLAKGAGPERVVALCLERSAAFGVGWLAVLKSGAICLPLDPSQPIERLQQLMRDAGAVALIGGPDGMHGIDVTGIASRADAPDIAIAPAHGAYLIFTSGSTGAPKGVVISHDAIAHYSAGVLARLVLPAGTSMAMVSTPAADLGHTMLFGALCGGHPLHMIAPRCATDPDRFADYMATHGVGALKIVPSHLRGLLEARDPANVLPHTALVLGGEATSAALATRLHTLRPGMQLFNHYGPTETTVGVLTHHASADPTGNDADPIATGAPLPGTHVYVLDRALNPVPAGVAGELYVGGAQVARGYLHQPALTAGRFLPDPQVASGRMYRTGDRVRQDAAGRIHYLGRADEQVKIRGYRVEPGEVAHAVRHVDGVRDAVVLVRDARLVAWCVLDGATPDAVRAALQATLPDHMVPSHVVAVDRLPVTANGKLDRRALPDPEAPASAFVAPRTETESIIAQVWQDVLGVPQAGATDNFFALGGDSILTLKVIARLKKAGRRVLPKQVFEHPELSALAQVVDAAQAPATTAQKVRADRNQRLPLSFSQQRLWFLWQLNRSGATYNIPRAVRLRGALDASALQRTFDALIARHEALRTTFDAQGSDVWQRVHPPAPASIVVTDLRDAPHTITEHADAEALAPFDLETGPLLRVRLLKLADDDHVLLVTLHHIVADGWSMGIVIDEFAQLYSGFVTDAPATLPALALQYVDHAAWQHRPAHAETLARDLDWWRRHLEGAPRVLALPTDMPRAAMPSHEGAVVGIDFPPPLVAQMRDLAQSANTTLFAVLLAAFQALLYRRTGEASPCIGVPIANRHRAETADVVGVFINTQVWRARIAPDMTYATLLAQVRQTAVDAQAHQDLPFEQLVEALQPPRDVSRNPLFQVMANHQRRDRSAARRIAGLTLEPVERQSRRTKLDLSLDTQEDETGALAGTLGYPTELFHASTVMAWRDELLDILAAMVTDPQAMLGASSAPPAISPANTTRTAPRPYMPPRTPTQQWLATAWMEALGTPRIGLHDNVFDLGAHSLLCLRVLASLRTASQGRHVELRDLMQYPTVAQLAEVIDQADTSGDKRPHGTAIRLNREVRGATPLFCVHASFGTVSDYSALGQALDGERTVYGLACPPAAHLTSIDALAQWHVDTLKSTQPAGPYQVLGWSLGGALAARMAAILELAGDDVVFVGLVDSYVPKAADHVGQSRGSIEELVDYLEQAMPQLDRQAFAAEVAAARATLQGQALVERILYRAFAMQGDGATNEGVQAEVERMFATATRLRALAAGVTLQPVRAAVENWWTTDRADADIARMHALLPACTAPRRIDATHLGIVRAPAWISAVKDRLGAKAEARTAMS